MADNQPQLPELSPDERARMRRASLLGWGVLLGLLAVLWWLFGEDPNANYGARGGPLYEAGAAGLEDMQTIILHHKNTTLDFTLDNGHWYLTQADNYPANTQKLRGLINAILQSHRRAPKTMDRGRFDEIGLADEAYRITIRDGQNETLLDLQLGERSANTAGKSLSYVYLAGDSRAWLTSNLPVLDMTVGYWAQPLDFVFAPRDVAKILKDERLLLERAIEGADFALSGVGEDKSVEAWVRAEPSQLIKRLKIEDVKAVSHDLPTPLTDMTLEAFDGQHLTILLYSFDSRYWVTFEGGDGLLISGNVKDWLFAIDQQSAEIILRELQDYMAISEVDAEPT